MFDSKFGDKYICLVVFVICLWHENVCILFCLIATLNALIDGTVIDGSVACKCDII